MSFLYGVIGTLVTILALTAAFIAGWKVHAKFGSPIKYDLTDKEKEEIEKERNKLKAQQEAFRVVQNYSAERAYGMVNDGEQGGIFE